MLRRDRSSFARKLRRAASYVLQFRSDFHAPVVRNCFYTYDVLNRLKTKTTGGATTTYGYDGTRRPRVLTANSNGAAKTFRGLYLPSIVPSVLSWNNEPWKDREKVKLFSRLDPRVCVVDQFPFPVHGTGRTVSEVSRIPRG